eukprot:5311910-Amphidinium_carterae.1
MVSQVPEVPAIGEVQEVHSSTQSSSTEGSTDRTSRRDSADYWENIVECIHDYYKDENEVTAAVSLHEGITRTSKRREAKRDYEMYRSEQATLVNTLQQDYESANGRIEDVDEFKTAWEAKDEDTICTIVYHYASDIRERKARWREAKIIEDNKKKCPAVSAHDSGSWVAVGTSALPSSFSANISIALMSGLWRVCGLDRECLRTLRAY